MIYLETVILRPLEPEDVDRLYVMRNDWAVVRHLGGFSFGFTRREMADWAAGQRGKSDRMVWAIAARADNVCIGHVGLYQIDNRVRKAEFAIVVGDPAWQGKGVGKAVSRAVVDYGFDQLNLHKIWLWALATNERAIRLYEALRFRRDGVLRDEQFRDGRYVDGVLMTLLESERVRADGSGAP